MIRSFVAIAVCSVALIGAGGASAASDRSAASSDVSDFAEFFAFVAAAPLMPAERERLARAVDAEARAHPAEVRSARDDVREFRAALAKAQPLQRADLRERLRVHFESLPGNDALRQIVDRTDPVLIFDKPNNRLITEGTLAAWQRAGVWMTEFLSIPRPGDDFIATQRRYVKTHYASLPNKEQEVIAHVERNYPAMVAIIDAATPAKRAAAIAAARPEALDRSKFGLRLADVMAQFYDIALNQEFMSRLIGNMAVLNNGLLQAPMYTQMLRNIGEANAGTNAMIVPRAAP